MKKYIVIGIMLVLLIFGFCGCTEQQTSGDTNQIQLVGYNVESQIHDWAGSKTLSNGFVYSDEVDRYSVEATIKNIGNEFIDIVQVTAKFVDIDGNVLGSDNVLVFDIAVGYTKTFTVYFSDDDYLEFTNDVRFEFKVS